ncbi:hypothetical protein [Brachybacterium huguangmaarense]
MSALVTITGDGTLRAVTGAVHDGAGDLEEVRLRTLLRVRSLLGDGPEAQIATRLYLPAALGTESADHLLPATLALLAGTTGDLASYGWRLGTGASAAWHRARELRERTLEAARIALLGFDGPVALTVLGPLSLAAATHLGSGERTLADRGAVRDLPFVLAEGVAAQAAALAERAPGAVPAVLVREDAAAAVAGGLLPTASGYRRHAPVPAPEAGARWQDLLEALSGTGIGPDAVTLALPADPALLEAARTAGARRLAVDLDGAPGLAERRGRALWESLAGLREEGVALELTVDPARVEQRLDAFARAWSELGFAAPDARGFTLVAHRRDPRAADPAREPAPDSLLEAADLERVLRAAPAWAERVEA